MAVDDLWFRSKREKGPDGKLLPPVPTERHGRGKRYRVRWIDDHGKPRTQSFDRKVDADRHDANVRADLSRGQYIDSRAGKVTVEEFGKAWRDNQIHADTTTVKVELAFRLHIDPILGGKAMGAVRRSHIQGWVKDRSAELAPTTLRVVYSYVASMFGAATLDRIIGVSPCTDITLPDVEHRPHLIPRPDQVHRIASSMPPQFVAAVYLAAGCGLRLGEALGLEVGDIDFLRREIRIVRQNKTVPGRKPFLGPLKTKTSRRTVELPTAVAEALARHIEAGYPKAIDVEDVTDPRKPLRRNATMLFVAPRGELLGRGAAWSRVWTPARKAAGLPDRWGYHGLRHYFATLLIHAGASVKTVQLALGHSTPTITLNTYVGEWPEAIDRTRTLVDAALGKTAVAPTTSVTA